MKRVHNTERRHGFLREIIETLILTALMFLLIRSAVQNFSIQGTSMEPTLHNQELILVDKWSYYFRAPARGDVIVFRAPPQPSEDYVKRIIAVPGDVVTVKDGVPTVNGVTLQEFYVAPQNRGATYWDKTINHLTIPQGDYFVMGDNRVGSSDSRTWGLLPRGNIIGRAALVYWPVGQDNDGLLPNASSVFANVHQPTPHSSGALQKESGLAINSTLFAAIPVFLMVCFWYRKKRH